VFGDGSAKYPYYQINVVPGECTRLRWILSLFELCGVNIMVEVCIVLYCIVCMR